MWPFKPNISKLEKRSDIKGLIAALTYKRDPQIRAFAAQSLGNLGATEAGPALTEALKDPGFVDWDVIGRSSVRADVAGALSNIKYPPAVPELIALLGNAEVRVRRKAAEALDFQCDRRATQPLAAALKDEHIAVRYAAVMALKKLADADAADALIAVFRGHPEANGEEWSIIYTAAEALGELRDKSAVEPLIEALGSRDSRLRLVSIRALGAIGDPRAKHALSVIALEPPAYDYEGLIPEARKALDMILEKEKA